MKRRHAPQVRLERAGVVAAEPAEIVDAIGRGARHHRAQHFGLGIGAGDHELADALVRDSVFGAIGVELMPARDAIARL